MIDFRLGNQAMLSHYLKRKKQGLPPITVVKTGKCFGKGWGLQKSQSKSRKAIWVLLSFGSLCSCECFSYVEHCGGTLGYWFVLSRLWGFWIKIQRAHDWKDGQKRDGEARHLGYERTHQVIRLIPSRSLRLSPSEATRFWCGYFGQFTADTPMIPSTHQVSTFR